jgi:predicted MFS family arabinose efflux permease
MAGFMLNLVDRQILSVLLQPLKAEFAISDTALGLLTGFAFAAVYATLCIPIARWADRSSRPRLLALSMAVWSAATAACGMAQSLLQLVALRFAVGIGEAGYAPAATALVADYAPAHRRATAIAVAQLGYPIGMVVGLLVGGWGLQHLGWRGVFLIAGIPGVIVSLVLWATVKEPMERRQSTDVTSSAPSLPFKQSLATLWHCRTYRYIVLANCWSGLVIFGVSTWLPAFLLRTYALPPAKIAYLLAPSMGVAGAIGYLAGGLLSDRLSRRSASSSFWLCAAMSLMAIPMIILATSTSHPTTAIISYAAAYLFGMVYAAPTVAAICSIVPPQMRAFAIAILLFAMNLTGLGLGPLLVGALSDASGGTGAALGQALRAAGFLYVPAALLYVAAARYADADFGTVAAQHGGSNASSPAELTAGSR